MPDLLFELFSEEIPARMQRSAAADLQRLVTGALVEAGCTYEGAKAYATPRRLCLHIVGLPARQPDTREEKKGPRVGAPEAAVQGFLKSAGLASLDEAKIESDPKKGEFYVAVIEKKGRATIDLLAEILPATIRAFPWPKSMRWGAASAQPGSLRWVRPLRSILATFGAETEDTEIVPFDVDGLKAGNTTHGHRFLAPAEITVRRFDDYVSKLEAAKVVLDTDRRKDIIRAEATTQAFAQSLEVIEDEGLLEEVAGLVEWPQVLMGSFEEEFLDVPAEVIRATIRANQKCFVLKKSDGNLANKFLLTANIEATDGGKVIVHGNERVIRARLSDAKFFWDTDRKTWANDPEFTRLERFKNVTFHEKLGSQWDRIERIRALAKELCKVTGANEAEVDLAARICKADLQTEVVGEFPEVQGLMGRKYATILGLPASVAAACEEHYKPVGPTDTVPSDKVSVTVALADKLDTLVGFWAIDEKPTGSKDPYALRRAALGVIRLVVENGVRTKIFRLVTSELVRRYLPSSVVLIDVLMKETTFSLKEAIKRALDLNPVYRSFLIRDDLDDSTFKTAVNMFLIARQQDPNLYRDLPSLRERTVKDFEIAAEDDTNDDFGEEDFVAINRIFDRMEIADAFRDVDVDFSSSENFANNLIDSAVRRLESSAAASDIKKKFTGSESELHSKEIDKFGRIVDLLTESAVVSRDLLSFFHDRLKVMLRDQGARHDLVDAVLGNGEANDDLLLVVERVKALGSFLDTEDGKSLLAGFKRAANILRAEEKKDGEGAFEAAANPALLSDASEKALHDALSLVGDASAVALQKQDYEAAMRAFAKLRAPVDAFFEAVMVNAEDPAIRLNRLALLAALRRVTRQVADFSRIAG